MICEQPGPANAARPDLGLGTLAIALVSGLGSEFLMHGRTLRHHAFGDVFAGSLAADRNQAVHSWHHSRPPGFLPPKVGFMAANHATFGTALGRLEAARILSCSPKTGHSTESGRVPPLEIEM